jgi:3-oxoacyl-[acyl-carrier protein] reductase
MDIRLDGKIALVTGSSKGLGLAMATEFARSGASVVMTARRADVLEEARAGVEAAADGGRVVAFAHDVARAEDCAALHAEATAALGPIDILVNNAGHSARGKFEEVTDESWAMDLDLKLYAAIRLMRLCLPSMRERRAGRVINVLNIGAKAPIPEGAPTVVSRAAGMSLTKTVATEYAQYNVTVNALLVGTIESDQWARRHAAAQDNRAYEDYLAEMGKPIPMGRVGRAEEFAAAACFLASEQAGYITGTAINVDGGKCPVV